MAKEIILRAAIVSDKLTRAASRMILNEFGGFYATEGAGGYTFADGQKEIVPSIAWHIGTAVKDSERFEKVSAFARAYCEAGNQESIYFLDSDGAAYLVDVGGRIAPLGVPEHADSCASLDCPHDPRPCDCGATAG